MMTKVKLRYVQAWVDKNGRARVHFRRPGYPRIALPPIGSPGFLEAYEVAMRSPREPIGEAISVPGSVTAAIAAYYQSDAWMALSAGTRSTWRGTLERFRSRYGERPLARMHQDFVEAYLATMKPHARLATFKALRHWLRHTRHDVTKGMDRPTARSTKRHSWTAEEVAQFEAHWPIGSKPRLAFALARFTGAGRAEIARMGPSHITGGMIEIKRQKTGVEASILLHPELKRVLEATAVTGLVTFLVTKSGKRYAPTALSNQFRVWCDAARLPPRCVLHGLRHAMGDALAESGASMIEIASVLGHAQPSTSAHYTKGADRKRISRRAMKRLVDGTGEER